MGHIASLLLKWDRYPIAIGSIVIVPIAIGTKVFDPINIGLKTPTLTQK
jgi:hypothetical protein